MVEPTRKEAGRLLAEIARCRIVDGGAGPLVGIVTEVMQAELSRVMLALTRTTFQ